MAQTLMLFALLGGFVLSWTSLSATRLLTALATEPEPQPLCQVDSCDLTEPAENQGAQFVQEPLSHSSFRPDFSSGLRRAHQRNNFTMLRAFSEAVVDTRLSTVQLLNEEGRQIALGAIVDSDGWIATKASQLSGRDKVTAQLSDNSELVAEIVQLSSDYDIALLRVQRDGLSAVHWANSSIPSRGTWLATTDIAKMPTAVGVVSAGIQSVRSARAVLGVELTDSTAGAAVVRVLMGTGAEQAGLRVGDNIIAVNGSPVASHQGFQRAIDASRGGTVVKLTISRAEKEFEINAQLMDLADELLDETEMEVNGPVSARATGFDRVFLHDTVLDPTQCGGPLCNLDGQVVGLNIARAGRVSSYALPADVLQPLLQGMIAQATLVSRSVSPPVAGSVR
ncbi:MAG: PDZ domain-containing protein [Pirellulaceae bacterium]|jgi:serine protease Do|nr:PDZ domain-containing protein [Pirellulaceae bacterium]